MGRHAWSPDETLTAEEAIRAYCMGSAYAGHMEERIGSLEVGKLADLIVLDRNLFDLPADSIHTAKVTRTLLGGRTVYP